MCHNNKSPHNTKCGKNWYPEADAYYQGSNILAKHTRMKMSGGKEKYNNNK